MTQFARCYLLVFGQLAAGGLVALAVPPFPDMARGYYKSSAGVFLSMLLLGAGGTGWLWWTRPESGIGGLDPLLWTLFTLLCAAYMATLWGERALLRARLYPVAMLTGLVAVGVSAAGLSPAWPLLGVLDGLASALVLGAVVNGMLIGHWYLVDPGLTIAPFARSFRWFVGTLWLQVTVLALALAVLWSRGASPDLALHLPLIGMRLALGPLAALGMAALLGRVLAIPQTMAATGLFYIASLAVLVGEMLGRYLTFRSGLPL